MKRLVVVSNRLPPHPVSRSPAQRATPVGGLASALKGALKKAPGSLWLGWSGTVAPSSGAERLVRYTLEGVHLAGLHLTSREVSGYYRGFANEALWPLCHGFQGRVQLSLDEEATYRRVNARFARALRPLLADGDLIWVHDYHLILLGSELRRLGWTGRIGFFLHIPFPPHEQWRILPDPRGFLEALMDYDLVGFQSRASFDNYTYCCRRELDATVDGVRLTAGSRTQRSDVYPIGIDPHPFRPSGQDRESHRLRRQISRVIGGRRMILGVDRLDYTKGIPERLLAFEELIRSRPDLRRKIAYVQIASPTRSRMPHYVEQKRRVDHLVGRINGEMADHDWVPIRYLYRSYAPETLAEFYRAADVGMVTPLRDGMNLIAKEYVAAQNPDAPGVLVLSRFAGAAESLTEAILVNPFIPSDSAAGVARALEMPLAERRERHAAMLRKVVDGSAAAWSEDFLADLESVRRPAGLRPEVSRIF